MVLTHLKRPTGLAANILVLAGSTLVSLLLLEAGIRVAEALRPSRDGGQAACAGEVYEFSPSLHHRFVPGACTRHQSPEFDYLWTINSLGMRDGEHPRSKPAGSFRILLLGDSFVQGHGVRLEDAMARRLEASLARAPRGRSIEVLNAGVFGYSPLLEWLYLRELIQPFDPDLVIVGFFLGNDVGEDAFYTSRARFAPGEESAAFDALDWPWSAIVKALNDEAGPEPSPASAPVGRRMLQGVRERSELLQFVSDRLADSRSRRAYVSRREQEFALVASRRGDIRYDLGLVNYPSVDRESRLRHWSLSLGYLEKALDVCRAHGTPMVLMVIPPIERLLGATTLDEPYEVLKDFGRVHDLPVVDLLPSFLGEPPESLYYKYDRHWTRRGHQKAADILEAELRRWQLLPSK